MNRTFGWSHRRRGILQIAHRVLCRIHVTCLLSALPLVGPLSADPFPLQITEIMYHPAEGKEFEFIELQNTGPIPIDLSLATWEGIDFRFPQDSIIQPNEVWVLASNDQPEAFAERYPNLNPRGYFGRKLSNSGETLTLSDPHGRPVAWASYRDDGFWPKEADGQGFSLERHQLDGDPNSPTAWRLSHNPNGSPGIVTVPQRQSPIQIVEVFASADRNTSDEVDFVELWNGSETAIDLTGWRLSDSEEDLERFVFPPATSIDAMSFLSVPLTVSSNTEAKSGFALNSDGETLFLYDNEGQPIDGIRFGQQLAGYSVSRFSTGWALSFPSPGSENKEAPTADPAALRINEWKADAESGDSDWIELFNTNPSLPVSLAGLCIGQGEIMDLPAEEVVITPFGAEWTVFRGRTSPTPDDPIQWIQPDFATADWETLPAPFYVGSRLEHGTPLLDMSGHYTSLLMRQGFEWPDFNGFESLRVNVRSDDGFIAWFNGLEWGRLHVPGGPATIDLLASNDGAGQSTEWHFEFQNFPLFLKNGTNTVAVQAVASETSDDDFYIDFSLTGLLPPQSAFTFRGSSPLSPLSFVAPQGFIRLDASEQTGVHDLQFRIPAEGTTLALTSSQGEVLNTAPVSVASEGASEGRAPDGSETIQYFVHGDSPGRPNLPDRDSDGIPDNDETELGLDPADPTDALRDNDNDGFSNLHEFTVGTDPDDPSSLARIQIGSISNDGTLTLIVPQLVEKSYSLETTTDLFSEPWSELALITGRTPSESGSLSHSVEFASETAFFRMVGLAEVPGVHSQQTSVYPPNNHTLHPPGEAMRISLSAPLKPANLGMEDAWKIVDDINRPVELEVRYDAAFTEVTLRPRLALKNNTLYRVDINPELLLQNGNSVRSEIGNWTFTTASALPLTDDPTAYLGDTDGVLRLDLFVADGETPYTFDDLLADNARDDAFDPLVRVRVTGEDYTPSQTGSNGTMKVRGASSRVAIQKSFRIDLDANEALWRGHRRINLMKHPFELSRVRNRLSFELFKQISHLTSLRTKFVHLFVNGEDRGLYSQIEQYNDQFLQTHGLDPNGHLYKANFFEWYRYPDQLRLKTDPLYNKSAFESILEIEGRDNHEKILRLLDDINNPELNFQKTFDRYFNRDNYLTWLAVNLLMGNIDTNSQNFLLYSPSDSQTWYFLPWDYDGAWGLRRQPDNLRREFPRWQEGLATYWNVVLHKRFMTNTENRLALESRIAELRATHLSDENVKAVLNRYRDTIETFVSRKPDIDLLPVSRGEARTNVEVKLAEWAGEFDRLPSELAFNESLYFQALERPMPVFLGTPTQSETSLQFTWSESDHLLNRPIHYDFELSASPTFEDDEIIARQLELNQTSVNLSPIPPPGDYYFRVIIRDTSTPTEHWQIPFSSFFDTTEGRAFYGTRQFTVR